MIWWSSLPLHGLIPPSVTAKFFKFHIQVEVRWWPCKLHGTIMEQWRGGEGRIKIVLTWAVIDVDWTFCVAHACFIKIFGVLTYNNMAFRTSLLEHDLIDRIMLKCQFAISFFLVCLVMGFGFGRLFLQKRLGEIIITQAVWWIRSGSESKVTQNR